MIMVNDVLSDTVITSFTSNDGWSSDLKNYLLSISDSISTHITLQYDDLRALDSYEVLLTKPNVISQYLYDKTCNEVERIYSALTAQYNPMYNYHRTITEKNSGSNNNIYSGTDTESYSGKDAVNVKDDLTVNNTINKDVTTVSKNTYDKATNDGFRPTDKSDSEYSDTEKYDGTTDTTTTYGKSVDFKFGKNLEMKFGRSTNTEIDGTNGIYPYPDLIKKEYDLRMSKKLFDTVIMLLVNVVTYGVWTNEVDDV